MAVSISDLSPNSVSIAGSSPVLAHAAAELRAHLSADAGSGPKVPVSLTANALASDGFAVLAGPEAVRIEGDSARGTLNGVYWLLERLGWLWVRPGPDGSRFVRGMTLADGVYRERPTFGRRTLILGNDALHDEWPDWFEFASRNRYNSVFLHDTPPSVLNRAGAVRPDTANEVAADAKGWMFERWDADGPAILESARERGLALQFGGHHLPALLRRDLFGAHQDWFTWRNGERDARYNLCTSSAGALAEVRTRAREFFARFSGAAVYHLWADDIVGGGWCSCEACAELSPSDQALRATNTLAEVLAETDPSAVVAHLAYHDTIAPPTVFRPAANVSALYAPRNRNYAFPIVDPACRKNADGHYAELLGLCETFTGRQWALAAFEYYSDAILYKWLDPPNLGVLPADARAYSRAGVFDYGNLAVTPRPWVGPTWHAWWFARCAWDAESDPVGAMDTFCNAAFEGDGPLIANLYRELEKGYRLLLDLGNLERIPRYDVLDFSDTPREALERKAAQLGEAVTIMNAAVANLPMVPAGLGRAFREDIAIQLAGANHLAARTAAWDHALARRASEAAEHLQLARLHLSAMEDWDRTHSRPGYANLSRGMLRAARFYTERVASLIG